MDSTIPAPQLSVDIWLLVFDYIDLRILWATCRGVSHYLRACVDEYFRHGTLQNTFVDLHYADIHMRRGPVYNYVHVPMVFDRLADGGKRAVFRQKAYKEIGGCKYPGTIRGWVPFIQRYCAESQKPKPKVLNKTKSDAGGPLWEQEHLHWRNTLSGDRKKNYLQDLGNMTSIGRGDRPPFYLKILDRLNDTELVDLVIDCKLREISFDWPASFSLFFREVSFAVRAHDISGKARVYDEELVAATSRYFPDMDRYTNATRARHKRLQPWVAKNKKRMSPEVRLWTERRFDAEKVHLALSLRHDNLRDMDEHDMLIEKDELVPEKLADDHFDLLFWPWTRDDTFFVPVNHFGSRLKCCNIL